MSTLHPKETREIAERSRSHVMSRREALRITAVAGLGLAFGAGITRELVRMAGLAEVRSSRRQLGTQVTISVLHPDRDAALSMVDTAFHTMERLESILSRHRDDTALSRLNTYGTLVDPPPDLVGVIDRALRIAHASDGAFDPTVGPLLDLYERWAREGRSHRPDRREVESALALVDYRDLRASGNSVTLARAGMGVTLDGIAKGYVVDCTTESLVGDGAERVMVEAGGDLASGHAADAGNTGRSWQLAIRDPRATDTMLGTVSISGEGMASSGDYIQSFTSDRSLHHILDPRTGHSPTELAATTVIAPSAMDADALSTAAMIMGPEAGLALIESMDGAAALFVTKEGRRIASRGFSRYVTPEST